MSGTKSNIIFDKNIHTDQPFSFEKLAKIMDRDISLLESGNEKLIEKRFKKYAEFSNHVLAENINYKEQDYIKASLSKIFDILKKNDHVLDSIKKEPFNVGVTYRDLDKAVDQYFSEGTASLAILDMCKNLNSNQMLSCQLKFREWISTLNTHEEFKEWGIVANKLEHLIDIFVFIRGADQSSRGPFAGKVFPSEVLDTNNNPVPNEDIVKVGDGYVSKRDAGRETYEGMRNYYSENGKYIKDRQSRYKEVKSKVDTLLNTKYKDVKPHLLNVDRRSLTDFFNKKSNDVAIYYTEDSLMGTNSYYNVQRICKEVSESYDDCTLTFVDDMIDLMDGKVAVGDWDIPKNMVISEHR